MADIKIRVHGDLSKEYMYDKGLDCGLSQEAAEYFKYFNEVAVDLIVDSTTGEVKEVQVPSDDEKETEVVKNPCPDCKKEWKSAEIWPCPHCGCEIPF